MIGTPVDAGARAVAARTALRHLLAAKAAGKRLKNGDDTEALHDARVALRRLRSVLRAYASCMEDAAPKRIRRRLRALGRATAAARDAEVQFAWVAGLERKTPPEQAACGWLQTRLGVRRDAAYRAMRSNFRSELAALEKDLRPRLAKAQRADRRGVAYGAATGRFLLAHVADLETRLRSIEGAGDRVGLHRARIAGKRLRYLLEPLAEFEPATAGPLAEMKRFQDCLGQLGDAHVRTGELERAAGDVALRWAPAAVRSLVTSGSDRQADPDVLVGLFALALRTRAEVEAGYRAFRERYLDSVTWLAPLGQLARRLQEAPAVPRREPSKPAKTPARSG